MALNIENKKQLAILLLAVGLGLVAAFLTAQYVQTNIQQQAKMIAAEQAKSKALLEQELMKMRQELQRSAAELNAVKKAQEQLPQLIQQAKQMQGQGGQPAGQQAALSVNMPEGKRAFTIQIDPLSAVGGLINPGDFIDIIAQLNVPEAQKPKSAVERVTTVLFQNVEVLAVNANFTQIGTTTQYEAQQKLKLMYVTLALDPDQAALLPFVLTNGTIQLSLRSPNEQEAVILKAASWEELSDYLKEKQGTEIVVPQEDSEDEEVADEPKKEKKSKPAAIIMRGGKEI